MDGFIWTTRCLQKENTSLLLFLKDLQSRPRTRQMGYNKQRIHYRNKDLSVEQIFLLTSIGFVWDFRGNRDGIRTGLRYDATLWMDFMDDLLPTKRRPIRLMFLKHMDSRPRTRQMGKYAR